MSVEIYVSGRKITTLADDKRVEVIPDALTSLYGAGHSDATRTRECVAMPGKREQTILTPDCVLNAVQAQWPEGIALDPCAENPKDLCGAEKRNAVGKLIWPADPEYVWTLEQNTPAAQHYRLDRGEDGLELPWRDRTFVNPPYGNLKDWLHKSTQECIFEHIMLIPLRTQRAWFDLAIWDWVVFLRSIKFKGYAQAAPMPMVLGYCGDRKPCSEMYELGKVRTVVGCQDLY
jgi:hypothetical protein